MPLTLASSPFVTAALWLLFGVPVVLFLWFAADEDSARRHLGWLGRYMLLIIPAYAAAIGVVAAFTLKPVYDAWRRRRRG